MAINSAWKKLQYEQRGSSCNILFSITCDGESEEDSEEFNIGDLAVVRFKWKSKLHKEKMKIIYSFSSKKRDLAKNSAFKVSMELTVVGKKQCFCDLNEGWSDWRIMGENVATFYPTIPTKHYDVIVVIFTAWRVDRDRFSKLYQDTVFTDFNLSTPEGSVAVHKACLATYSDVFKAMLCGSWKETEEGEIKMEGVTLQTLKYLKEHLYLGTIPDADGLRPLLLIAKRYLIEDLEEQCIKQLALTVTPENLFSLIEFACENNIPELAFAIPKFTKDSVIDKAHEIREITKNMAKKKGENAGV